MKPDGFVPSPGAVRHRDPNGVWWGANPRDPVFSTATMLAEEFWDGHCWVRIWPEADTEED